jgi:hypothetical protein
MQERPAADHAQQSISSQSEASIFTSKAVLQFTSRLQSLETQFSDLYSKISSLEKELSRQKTVTNDLS